MTRLVWIWRFMTRVGSFKSLDHIETSRFIYTNNDWFRCLDRRISDSYLVIMCTVIVLTGMDWCDFIWFIFFRLYFFFFSPSSNILGMLGKFINACPFLLLLLPSSGRKTLWWDENVIYVWQELQQNVINMHLIHLQNDGTEKKCGINNSSAK